MMRVSAEDEGSEDLQAVDPASGEVIHDVLWADSDAREICVLKRDEHGRIMEDGEGAATQVVGRAFRIERRSTGEVLCEAA